MLIPRIIVGMFGWYGRLESREFRGELRSAQQLSPVEYINYDEEIFKEVADSSDLASFAFHVELEEKEGTTPPPTAPTQPAPALPVTPIVGASVGAVVAILIVILIIVILFCVWKKKKRPTKEKEVSIYDSIIGIDKKYRLLEAISLL